MKKLNIVHQIKGNFLFKYCYHLNMYSFFFKLNEVKYENKVTNFPKHL